MAIVFRSANTAYYSVSSRVGFNRRDIPRCPNLLNDVLLVQYLLKKFIADHPDFLVPGGNFAVDGVVGLKTLYAIVMLQSRAVGQDREDIRVFGDEWGCIEPVTKDFSRARLLHTIMGRLNDMVIPHLPPYRSASSKTSRRLITDQPDCPSALREALKIDWE